METSLLIQYVIIAVLLIAAFIISLRYSEKSSVCGGRVATVTTVIQIVVAVK